MSGVNLSGADFGLNHVSLLFEAQVMVLLDQFRSVLLRSASKIQPATVLLSR